MSKFYDRTTSGELSDLALSSRLETLLGASDLAGLIEPRLAHQVVRADRRWVYREFPHGSRLPSNGGAGATVALRCQQGFDVNLTGMKTRSGGWGRRFGALAAMLAVAALAGCSSDKDPVVAPPVTTTRFQPTTTTTTAVAEDPVVAEIVGRYRQYWEARFAANQAPPNPDAAGLKEYATGRQLEQVVAETRRNLESKLALRRAEKGVDRSTVKVVKVEADTATLQECVVDDDVVYRYQTGEVVNAAVATQNVEATMKKVDGMWRLAAARMVQRWEGVAGCALSEDL